MRPGGPLSGDAAGQRSPSSGSPADLGRPTVRLRPVARWRSGDRPIAKAVHPTGDQNAKLDALKNAEDDAGKTLSGLLFPADADNRGRAARPCPGSTPGDDPGGQCGQRPAQRLLQIAQRRTEGRFNALGQRRRTARPPNLAQLCGPNNAMPAIAVDQIDSAVKPDDKQRQALNALRDAAGKADDAILASCPKEAPLTPTGRLDAVKAPTAGDARRRQRRQAAAAGLLRFVERRAEGETRRADPPRRRPQASAVKRAGPQKR